MKEFLRFIKSRGLRLAAISNAMNHDEVIETLRRLDVLDYFDVVVTSDITMFKKPCREIFLITAELLGVKPDEVVHIGDSLADIDGALNAGYSEAIELARHKECVTRNCFRNLREVLNYLIKKGYLK